MKDRLLYMYENYDILWMYTAILELLYKVSENDKFKRHSTMYCTKKI